MEFESPEIVSVNPSEPLLVINSNAFPVEVGGKRSHHHPGRGWRDMKIIIAVIIGIFAMLACAHFFQGDVNGARYCVVIATAWMIYLKLLQMEDE